MVQDEYRPRSLAMQGTTREIVQRCLPVMVSFSIPQLNFLVNSVFVGKIDLFYLGAGAIVSIYYLTLSIIGIGFGNGVQIVMARYAGKDSYNGIRDVFHNACLWAVVLSLLFIGLTLVGIRSLFTWMLHGKELIEEATEFMHIRVWGLFPLYVYLLRNALFINVNRSRSLIAIALWETGINIVLDYCLIFGHFSFPKLGFVGAAYASVIAETLGFLAVAIQLYVKPLHPKIKIVYSLRFHAGLSKEIFTTSLPVTSQMLVSLLSWQVFFAFIANRGTEYLAASNILRNVFSLMNIFVWALGATTNSILSNLYGQQRLQDFTVLLRRLCRVSVIGTGLTAVCAIACKPILHWLFSADAQVLPFIEAPFFLLMLIVQVLGITSVFFNAFVSVSSGFTIIGIELVCAAVYLCYAYVCTTVLRLSLTWIWSSELIYGLVLGSGCWFFVQKWLQKYVYKQPNYPPILG